MCKMVRRKGVITEHIASQRHCCTIFSTRRTSSTNLTPIDLRGVRMASALRIIIVDCHSCSDIERGGARDTQRDGQPPSSTGPAARQRSACPVARCLNSDGYLYSTCTSPPASAATRSVVCSGLALRSSSQQRGESTLLVGGAAVAPAIFASVREKEILC